MNGSAASPVWTLRTSDPTVLSQALSRAELEPCQLSRGPAVSELARLLLPGTVLEMANLGPRMAFKGVMPNGFFTLIYVKRCPQLSRVFSFGIDHGDGAIGILPPGTPLDAITCGGYQNATLLLPADEFRSSLATRKTNLPDFLLARGGGIRLKPGHRTALDSLVAGLWDLARDLSLPLRSKAVQDATAGAAREVFLDAVADGTEHFMRSPGLRIARRHQRLRQAREYIAAHATTPVFVDDLCAETGIGRRALENLFRDLLDITPTAYLRHTRLHGVRQELKASNPNPGSVKRTALEWGFSHLGEFAGDYRRLFGEHPSDTLRS